MKICLVELMPFPYTVGGGTTHLMNLGKALSQLGNEVHIISSKPAKSYKKLEYSEDIIVHNVGLRHKRFEGSGKLYYLYRILFELFFIIGAMRALRKIKPDIIDCQSSITTALPASLSKYPFVITSHGIHALGFEKLYASKGKNFTSTLLNNIYLSLTKYNVRRAKKILSQGKVTFDYYTQLAGTVDKGVLVPNLVDTAYWKPNGKKTPKTIVAVARFTKQKALDKLILAMKLLKGYHLSIGGEGELEQELRALAGDNVEFLGYLSPAQCLELYQKTQFVLLPSEFEGLPYAILEAMSVEVLPITTKVGELQTLITSGKNGILLENNKPETIAKAIKKVTPKLATKLSKGARKTIVDIYGLESVAKKFISVYEEAITSP